MCMRSLTNLGKKPVTVLCGWLCGLSSLVTAQSSPVVLTEFMAVNETTMVDEDGDTSDWIEIYNHSSGTVNLGGWYLTDNAGNLHKWQFPSTLLQPQEFLLIFASGKDRNFAGQELHTNFKLGNSGEYLALVQADGVSIASEFSPSYPQQYADASYGPAFREQGSFLLYAGVNSRWHVPGNDSLGTSWTVRAFDDQSWNQGATGLGYETATGFESLIQTDLTSHSFGINASCYARLAFTVTDVNQIRNLRLRVKYDDGYVAYLNGVEVAVRNAPPLPTWNSNALTERADEAAKLYEEVDLTAAIPQLQNGANVLAIHALNLAPADDDFLFLPELRANIDWVLTSNRHFFSQATPGGPNGPGGPLVHDVGHLPARPLITDPVVVEARIDATPATVREVTLVHRRKYIVEQTMPMVDDGTQGDRIANDGIYAATIPAGFALEGELLRYAIIATDSNDYITRYPTFANPDASPQYLGTLIQDPTVASDLPILHWFIQNPGAANTVGGSRAALYYQDRLYDNVFVRRRGGSSSVWPKKSFKFDFNKGDYFEYLPGQPPVEEFNLNSTHSDKTYMRQVLGFETYAICGVPTSTAFPMRVQRNALFYSVAHFIEQVDDHYLARQGIDPNGALYKMYNPLTSHFIGVEKRTRKHEDNSDLRDLVDGVRGTSSNRLEYLFDNVDLPSVIGYIAATAVIHDNDHIAKNYFLYRDSDGDGEWSFLPWDKDLTLGRNYTLTGGVLNDTMWADRDPQSHPLFGDRDHPKNDGPWNRLIDAVLQEPETREMYLRRLRTLMDDYLSTEDIPEAERYFERRIKELHSVLEADVALDRQKWGNPYGIDQDLQQAIDDLRFGYLAPRRHHLFVTHGANATDLIPGPQTVSPPIAIGRIEWDPVSGNQAEEFVELINSNSVAVDLSGWRLSGTIAFDFPPGTVMRSNSSLFVSPDVGAFRNRATPPTGGNGHFVLGSFSGQLPGPDPVLNLTDAAGDLIFTTEGPYLDVPTLIADEKASIRVLGSTPMSLQVVAYSLTGGGPSQSPWGVLDLSPPLNLLFGRQSDWSGSVSVTFLVPPYGYGKTIWMQAFDCGSRRISQSRTAVIRQ